MFIAQANLCEHLAERATILSKDCAGFLIDFRVRSLHRYGIGGIEVVGICTVVVAVLASDGQVAFPDRIPENELRCPEVVAANGVALYAAVRRTTTSLCRHLLCVAR